MKFKNFSLLLALLICTSVFPCSLNVYASQEENIWEDVAFFGDSTTHGMIRYIVNGKDDMTAPYIQLHRDQILTPPEGTFYLRNIPTTCIQYRGSILPLKEALQSAHPGILIVTVGINGLSGWDEKSFTELYNRLIDIITASTPQSQIILQSIFPVAKNRAKRLSSFTVERVDMVNEWIRSIADQHGYLYINSADVLKDDDGWLRPEYQNGDGLHLNAAGFNCVLQNIELTLQKLKGKNSNQ